MTELLMFEVDVKKCDGEGEGRSRGPARVWGSDTCRKPIVKSIGINCTRLVWLIYIVTYSEGIKIVVTIHASKSGFNLLS